MARTIPNKGYGGIYGAEAAGKAANDFANAENAASGDSPKINDNSTSGSADIAENGGAIDAPSYGGAAGGAATMATKMLPFGRIISAFRGNGGGAGGGSNGNAKPLIAIGGTTGLVALIMTTIMGALPIHLTENMIDLKDSFNTTSEMRGSRLLRRVIGKDNTAAMNAFSKRNTLSTRKVAQMNRGLEAEGLRLVKDGDNIVLHSALDADGKINLNADGSMRWNTAAVNEVEFAGLIREHPNIRNGFNKGARTMKGRIAGWFNSAGAFMLRKLSIDRNVFKDFRGRAEGNTNFKEAKALIATAEAKATANNVNMATQEIDLDTDPDKPKLEQATADRNFHSAKTNIETDIKARAAKIAGKIGAAAGLVGAPCAVFMAVSAASAVFAAIEAAKGLKVVSSWFEAGQKTLAGNGDDSYHAFGDALTEATVTNFTDENGDDHPLHNGVKVSATESAGLTQVLVGGTFSAEDDKSALKYHAEKAVGFAKISGVTASTCAALMFTGALVGLVTEVISTVISFIPVAGQVFALGKAIAKVAVDAGIQVAISASISIALASIVPMLAKAFVTTIATDVGGEDFGNLIGSVGGRYMSNIHQGNGGVVATEERAYAYYVETQAVLAQQAELDRAERSPFDITNKNTFLGSLAYSLSGFAATNGGVGSIVGGSLLGNFTGLLGAAQSARLPWTYSANAANSLAFKETLGNCPQLSSLNPDAIDGTADKVHTVACDLFGNPMRSNDLTTVEYDPEFIWWKTAYTCNDKEECSFGKGRARVTLEEYNEAENRTGTHLDGTAWTLADPNRKCSTNVGSSACNGGWYEITAIDADAKGFEKVNPKSDLGKTINYGVNRSTDPGVLDMNIVMAEDNSGPDWIGWMPIIGDIQGMISAVNQSTAINEGWADGKNYCNGCTAAWDSTYKYLNQYIVDNNLYEGFGAIEKSPAVAYLENEVWPTMDMSAEGVIARNSGLPKTLVTSTLAWVYDMLNTPQNAYALVASAPNIYAVYYGGANPNELTVPQVDNPCELIEQARECTRIAGTELRRRFNFEAVA